MTHAKILKKNHRIVNLSRKLTDRQFKRNFRRERKVVLSLRKREGYCIYGVKDTPPDETTSGAATKVVPGKMVNLLGKENIN